ncbi:Serine/threonine-protein kinase AFC3 [Cardamine amara subsp. amara]|uniref:Serine/threonine-protein kinase PRP4 homolog n=1 Tax=Cardamine amara subsp. amara TaxID=228776 RepID=A0ABD1C3C7_CARAN
MVSDKLVESNHRKHRRSSSPSDEVVKSSKRHKHRHHKHHRKHRHRHHRDKKHDEEAQYDDDETAVDNVSPSLKDPTSISNGSELDMEEGEILEEGRIGEKKLESNGKSGELKSDQFRENNLPVHVDSLPDDGLANYRDCGKHAQQPKEGTFHCGLTRESERDGGYPSIKFATKSYEVAKKYSSENFEDKHKISTRSPSNTRHTAEVRARSRSRSCDRERDRLKLQIATEDEPAVRERHRDSSRDYCRDTFDLGRKEEKYHRRGHHKEDGRHLSREDLERERSRDREMDRAGIIKSKEQKGSKHRDRDGDLRREREWEKRKEIEAHRGRRKERDIIDRDRRGEKERDYLWDRDNDRGRSRERERGNERERRSEKERDKGREFQSDREKHKSEVRHKHSGHSRHDAEDDLEIRNSDSINGHNPKGNVERYNDENGWELHDQEDEELKRIEESRKRTQAILEKYKKKSEQQNGFSSHDKGKDLELAGIPKQSFTVADVLGSGTLVPGSVASAVNQAKAGFDNDAINGEVAIVSSAVRESPAQIVISDSDRTLASAVLGKGSPKSERPDDMFTDDIFGESPAGTQKMGSLRGKRNGLPIVRSGLHDNWDDAEGYYSYQFGELLDDRYEVMATHGKGVFSTVVRAKDTKAKLAEPEEVAIKIIRNNETMHKAGQTEVQILKKLAGSDPENKRHCVRFLSSFKYRNHLCLVFESLHLNLREILKKFGRDIGLKLSAVKLYAKQLFISLKHLKNCGVLHCDIKPDNVLGNKANKVLKLCDFGSAMFAGKNEVTPYLVSRFYRAPEIILGLSYDHPLDIWSVGCCLYELQTGKVLFPGSTNNDMLRLQMELKGPFPKKMLRKGAFIDQHFDQDLNFYATEEDSVTGKTIKRMMVNIKPKDFGSVIKDDLREDRKELVHFRDLLDKIFTLDPDKRLTVSQALSHPFITSK